MTFADRSRVYNHVVSELWLVVGSRSSPWSVVLEVTFWNRVKSIEVYVGIGTASKARPKHSAASDDGIPSHICFKLMLSFIAITEDRPCHVTSF